MKLSDYLPTNRNFQGAFWTVFSTRLFRLEKTIPTRVYYAKDATDLEKMMTEMMGSTMPPTASMDQALMLQQSDIEDLWTRLPQAKCAVIMNKSCNGIKEVVLAGRCDSQWGLTPLYRVRWEKSKKSFVSERLASQAYIEQWKEEKGIE